MIDLDFYRSLQYKSHGREYPFVDCWGKVGLFYRREFGKILPSWSAEYENSDKVSYNKIMGSTEYLEGWTKSPIPFFGAVAEFRIGHMFHVGVCLDRRGREVLSIMKKSGVTIIDTKAIEWRDRFKGWWKYNG
jgi:hypothetical protein